MVILVKLLQTKKQKKHFKKLLMRKKKLISWKIGKHLKLGKVIMEEVSLKLITNLAISDVAWSPDNQHFASCSTDSFICIWNVNDHRK